MSDPFAVHIDHHDGAVMVRLAGALEDPGLHALRARLWPLIARYDATMVTFDVVGLERIDPDGVRLLGQFARAVVDGGLDGWFEIDRPIGLMPAFAPGAPPAPRRPPAASRSGSERARR